ncbi:MAG TPA: XylR family transcriptional regulator [Opitutaceae bacterium]|jgi:LacI family transcriptional regulator
MKRPDVLLIFQIQLEECVAMLKGIAHFERINNIWAVFHDDLGAAQDNMRWIRDRKWKGVISRHTTPELARTCREEGIPLVDLHDVDPFPGVPKIRPDNARIGQLGAEHLLERGYRSFAFAGFSNTAWSRERRDGFTSAIYRTGHRCSVLDVAYPKGGMDPFWVKEQVEKLSKWLRELPKPAGVMACADLWAMHLIGAGHAADILMPEEVSVLGANNESFRCEMSIPALSSVAPNAFQSGFVAASVLNDMMNGRKIDSYDRRIEPSGVVERHSTDILAIDDEKVADAVNFIRREACKGLSVEQVAANVHISRSLLERRFRRHMGRSLQAEIRRVQVRRIKELLVDTDYPMKRIAELTGFEYTEYMSVLFKRMTGCPPGTYREKMQDKAAVRSTVIARGGDSR